MNAIDVYEAAQAAGIDPVTVLSPEEIDELLGMGINVDELDLSVPQVGHYDNLLENEQVDQSKFARLGQDVINWLTNDENDRKDWIDAEKNAIKALGISKDTQTPAFEGATTAIHPLFIESVEQFHNRALLELRPPNGNIVKTEIVGDETPEVQSQAERVQGCMNYLYAKKIPDEFNQTDKMLFRIPLSGSCFRSVYYCQRTKTFNNPSIEPSNFIVPWNAKDLQTTPHYIIRSYESSSVFKRNVASGFYIGEKVKGDPSQEQINEVEQTIKKIEGSAQSSVTADHNYQILKCSCDLELEEGFDYPVPYLVWVEFETQQVIRIQRNWKPDDDQQTRIVRDVHYKCGPGLGFYGYGLYHLYNGVINGCTDMLQTIINAGILDANKRGYRSRDARIPSVNGRPNLDKDGKVPPPGFYEEINSSSEDLAKAFYTIPTSPPSAAIMQALEYLDNRGQSAVGSNGVMTGDETMHNTPVGTILALIEQGTVSFSAAFQRLHNAQTEEFRIMAEVIAENIPDEGYPYALKGNSSMVMASDFDERVDVIPVSSPDAASKSHRIMQANALVEMALKFPGLLDPRWVLEQGLDAMRIDIPDDKWIEQKPDPLTDAKVQELQAKVTLIQAQIDKAAADTANQNMGTISAGVDAGLKVMAAAAAVPVVDELMKSAGFVDHNGAPVTTVPQGSIVAPNMPVQPDMSQQAQPESPQQEAPQTSATVSDIAQQGMDNDNGVS
jgi:hypothetical protein